MRPSTVRDSLYQRRSQQWIEAKNSTRLDTDFGPSSSSFVFCPRRWLGDNRVLAARPGTSSGTKLKSTLAEPDSQVPGIVPYRVSGRDCLEFPGIARQSSSPDWVPGQRNVFVVHGSSQSVFGHYRIRQFRQHLVS